MPVKKILILFLLFFFTQLPVLAAYDFPFINITLKSPAQEDPYPGMGNNYSSLGKGIDTVLWNPAGLSKIGTTEIYVGLPTTVASPTFTKNYLAEDTGFDTSSLLKDITTTASTAGFSTGIIFGSDLTQTGFTTHELTGHLNYSTIPTGSSYKQALKAMDWLTFGISTHGESGYNVNIAGNFPAQLKLAMDWNNFPDFGGSGTSVDNGYLTVVYTPEVGPPITYKTPAPVWQGFLTQDQRIPITAIFNLENDLNVESSVTLTSAAKWGKLSVGANITPISATANINDSIRVIFNPDDPDIYLNMPNFDPKDQASIAQWVATTNLYSSPEGYKKSILLNIPAGDNLGELKYQGLLSAQTTRVDLGVMYELSDDITIGANFENINRASLDFKSSGSVTYANYRSLPSIGGASSNIPDTYTDAQSDTLAIEPEKNVPLPQRIRLGATLWKPYLLTMDYEWLLTPVTMRYNYTTGSKVYSDISFNDVRLIRVGFETQLFSYPAYLRAGSILLLTPELIGADRLTQQTFDSMFGYGFYPMKFDLGLRFPRETYEFGFSGGFSAMSFFSPFSVWFLSTPPLVDYRNRDMVSAIAIFFPTILTTANIGDTLNQDFNRIAYFSTYLKKDNWQMTFQNAFDIGSSGRAYNDTSSRKDVFGYLKWVTTLTLSLKF